MRGLGVLFDYLVYIFDHDGDKWLKRRLEGDVKTLRIDRIHGDLYQKILHIVFGALGPRL